METARQLDLAPSEASAVPRKALYVGSGDQMMPGTANLRSRTVDFPTSFFPFLEIFLSFSEKNKFRHFLWAKKNFKWKFGG